MDLIYLLSIIYLLPVAWMVFHWEALHVKDIPAAYTTAFFVLKVVTGWGIGWYYKTHYIDGADTYNYLEDTNTLFSFLWTAPSQFFRIMSGIDTQNVLTGLYIKTLGLWNDSGFDSYYNDARTVIRINVLIRFISFGYYQIHVIWMNVISFIGLRWIYLFFSSAISKVKWITILPFFLPSVFIWSSALLKEPIMIFALGWLLYFFRRYLQSRTMINKLLLFFPVLFFFFVKIYLLLLFAPGLLLFAFTSENKPVSGKVVLLVYGFSLGMILFLGSYFPVMNLPAILYGKQLNTLRFSVFMHATSYMHPLSYAPVVSSFLMRFPEAVWYAMKPFMNPHVKWSWIFNIETGVLVVLLLFHLLKRGKKFISSGELTIAFCVAIGLLALIGYTNMVFGTMIRYRVMAFLLMSIALTMKIIPVSKVKEKH